MSTPPNKNNEADGMKGESSSDTDYEGTFFLFDSYDILMILLFGNIVLMLLLFKHWNNTTEENEDTITDDVEGI